MTTAEIFRLFDQIAAGFEREAQLSEEEREAKREEILAWFRPLHAQLQAASLERPCPIPWTLVIEDGVDVPPAPEPHECAHCFNAVYAAWKEARGRATILSALKEGRRRMTSYGAAARGAFRVLLVFATLAAAIPEEKLPLHRSCVNANLAACRV